MSVLTPVQTFFKHLLHTWQFLSPVKALTYLILTKTEEVCPSTTLLEGLSNLLTATQQVSIEMGFEPRQSCPKYKD